MSDQKIRTLLIEDQPLICDALGLLLQGATIGDVGVLDVVGLSNSGEEGLARFGELQPDLVLLDLIMPGLSGLETLEKLRERSDAVRVIVLTAQHNPKLIKDAKRVGGNGFHLKNTSQLQLLELIEAVMKKPDCFVEPPYPANDGAPLTPRERDVLMMLADGYTNRAIADALCISMRTVEKHRENVANKLGYSSLVELKDEARKLGLIG